MQLLDPAKAIAALLEACTARSSSKDGVIIIAIAAGAELVRGRTCVQDARARAARVSPSSAQRGAFSSTVEVGSLRQIEAEVKTRVPSG